MPKFKKTLVLDFDGVLHLYSSGWHGANVVSDGPVPGAVAFIAAAVQNYKVAVYSSRSDSNGGIAAMRAALLEWIGDELGEPAAQKILDQVDFPKSKPAAFLAIDDRALTFTGVFPDLSEIAEFQPWNKRSAQTPYERDVGRLSEQAAPSILVSESSVSDLTVDDESGEVNYLAGADHMLDSAFPSVWPGSHIAIKREGRATRLARVDTVRSSGDGIWWIRAYMPARKNGEEV